MCLRSEFYLDYHVSLSFTGKEITAGLFKVILDDDWSRNFNFTRIKKYALLLASPFALLLPIWESLCTPRAAKRIFLKTFSIEKLQKN